MTMASTSDMAASGSEHVPEALLLERGADGAGIETERLADASEREEVARVVGTEPRFRLLDEATPVRARVTVHVHRVLEHGIHEALLRGPHRGSGEHVGVRHAVLR